MVGAYASQFGVPIIADGGEVNPNPNPQKSPNPNPNPDPNAIRFSEDTFLKNRYLTLTLTLTQP